VFHLDINDDWKELLKEEFTKKYFLNLKEYLTSEYKSQTIYPTINNIFTAYNLLEFEKIKVVIIGQDPYHGLNQAHGLAFSVLDTTKFPPSLINIFKELENDIGCPYPKHGNLSKWAEQGVLLINAVLTVRAGNAGSHRGIGWEEFSDATIRLVNEKLNNVVFILWGKPAQTKEKLIDSSKHFVLKAPHPSPLSAYRGFFGSKPFSQTNKYLSQHGKKTIDWCLD